MFIRVGSGKLIVAPDEGGRFARARGAAAARRRQWRRRSRDRDRAFIVARERPSTRGSLLWSPDSGIVNAEEFVKALLRGAAAVPPGAMFLPAPGCSRRPPADGMRLTPSAKRSSPRGGQRRRRSMPTSVADLGGETSRSTRAAGEYAEFTPAKRALVNALVYPLRHRSGHGLASTWCGRNRRTGVARAHHPYQDRQRRLRERSRAAGGVRGVGARLIDA